MNIIEFKPKQIIPIYIRTRFPHLSIGDKWFYVCLLDLCGKGKTCAYSLRKLQKETGLGIATLSGSIYKLHNSGLIEAEKRARTTGGQEVWHITLVDLTEEDALAISQRYEIIPPKKSREEEKRVNFQLDRTRESGLAATLTLDQWLETLEYFQWKCAYCAGEYEVIEHFIPIALGGGTTQFNCVPACVSCNNRKNSYHPLLMPSTIGMNDAIQTIQQYLNTCRSEEL